MGLWTIASYFFIQTFDGYVLVPLIAKKTVDLAPALAIPGVVAAWRLGVGPGAPYRIPPAARICARIFE